MWGKAESPTLIAKAACQATVWARNMMMPYMPTQASSRFLFLSFLTSDTVTAEQTDESDSQSVVL